MSTPVPRGIRVPIGLALLGYCLYEIYTGYARGSWRTFDRRYEPGSYWTSISLKFTIACGFLFGLT